MENVNKTEIANRIGRQEAYLGVGIALTIDLCVIGFNIWGNDFEWLLQNGFWWKLPMAGIIMIYVGQFLGKRCARNIIVQNSYWFVNGPSFALMTLAITSFLSGLLAMPIDLIFGDLGIDICMTYVFGMPVVVMFYSFIPVGVHGLWFGYRIYDKGKKYAHA